ncbi:MAG: sodium-dependent transporter [Lachnospiraceae bacterium]
MKREGFGSRLGFLLVSAGCAIGIGNVWKFPFVCGENGGGVFVLFYLIFLVIMGAPVLTMELAVGRASRQSAICAFRNLEPRGHKWHIHGYLCVIGNSLLMMYYTSVSGWMLNYFVKFLMGNFEGVGSEEIEGVFNSMLADPRQSLIFMAVTVVFGILVCGRGMQNGLEKVTKVMMLALLVLIVILAVHSLTLSGAGAGMRFYLLPDFARAGKMGLFNIITAAMNQSFFTLSLGIGAMEIFGSYMSDDYSLGGEAIRICFLDTFVAIMSGMIIFPACFSYGVETTQGPSLIFITLPQVFINMSGGRIWGASFFLFMTFASFSTVTAVFESLIAAGMDNFGWERRKSSMIWLVILLLGSIPCALEGSLLRGITLPGGKGILDFEDFIVSNLMLPMGSLIFLLFCTIRFGWGFDKYLAEANKGSGMKISPKLKNYFRFVVPVLILVILIQGLM